MVYNIGNGDEIHLNECSAQSVSVSGSDIIVTIADTEETITLKEAVDKNIYITGQDWKTYSASTSEQLGMSADIVDEFWFDDNNFMTDDTKIDSVTEISDTNYSVGNVSSLPSYDVFTQEKLIIATSYDKK